MLRRLIALTERARPQHVAALAALLTLPAVGTGFVADDWFHRSILLNKGFLAGADPLGGLFTFLDGGPRNLQLRDLGVIGWWLDPSVMVSFFRPLAALTHMFDYQLWPDTPALHHLHSVAWYAAGVAVIAVLYRRVLGAPAAAALAAVLFAVDDSHSLPAGWIANRNSLLTLVFGGLGILAHVRWRQGGRISWLLAGLAALVAGLLAGEATLGAIAYVAAWQLTMDRRSWARRLTALLPYAALVLAWRVAYDRLGYGARGSGLYIDPGHQPGTFVAALVERWPLLFTGQWLRLPVDLWVVLPRAGQFALTLAGAAGMVVVGWLLLPLVRQRPEARFWALGMSLSLVPLCAAFPMDRLLIFAGIGGAALMALLAQQTGWLSPQVDGHARGGRLVAVLLVVHLVLAPLALVGRGALLPLLGKTFAAGADHAPADPAVSEQTIVFVNGNVFMVAYAAGIRQLRGQRPVPQRVAQLSSMLLDNEVRREGSDTLVITAAAGFMDPLEQIYRAPQAPFAPGDEVRLPDYTATVRAVTEDGRPAEVAFQFHGGLANPRLRFVSWTSMFELQPFSPPNDGASVRLPAVLP